MEKAIVFVGDAALLLIVEPEGALGKAVWPDTDVQVLIALVYPGEQLLLGMQGVLGF